MRNPLTNHASREGGGKTAHQKQGLPPCAYDYRQERKRNVNTRTKKAICEDYNNREMKVAEIAKKHGIARTKIASIAVELGAEPRCAAKFGKTMKKKNGGESVRVCPKCRKAIDVKGARFCCFCGADIRSSKELLIDRVKGAMPAIMHLPQNMRDDMQRLFIDIIKEFERGA